MPGREGGKVGGRELVGVCEIGMGGGGACGLEGGGREAQRTKEEMCLGPGPSVHLILTYSGRSTCSRKGRYYFIHVLINIINVPYIPNPASFQLVLIPYLKKLSARNWWSTPVRLK